MPICLYANFNKRSSATRPAEHRDRGGMTGRAVTAADHELYIETDARANPGPLGAPRRESTRRNTVYTTRHPPSGRMLASRNDEVWIGPADSGESTGMAIPSPFVATRWSVYTTTGRWLSDVVLPRNFGMVVGTPASVFLLTGRCPFKGRAALQPAVSPDLGRVLHLSRQAAR